MRAAALVALVVAPLLPVEPRPACAAAKLTARAARPRSARGTRRRPQPRPARSSRPARRRAATPRPRRSPVNRMPASARTSASASRGSSPATSGVPVPGANAGSITSMSKLKNAGASPTRSRTRRAYSAGSIARSSSSATTSKPSRARLGEVGGGVERAAHAGQQRALRAQQPLLDRAPERRAVEVALAVVLVPRVGVRVEQHQRHRAVHRRLRAQLAEHDRVVAAEHQRHHAGPHDRLERGGDLAGGALGVAGRDRRGRRGRPPTARANTSTSSGGWYGRSPIEAPRIASGPKRAPGRRLVAVSNGTPTTATSTPSGSRHVAGSARRCARPCSAAPATASGGP